MARRQPDAATTAILAYMRKLERECNTLGEVITFGLMYLVFSLLDLCTVTMLSRALLALGRHGRNSLQWKSLLIAANSSLARKVRAKAFFYLGSASCALADRIDKDPVRCVQTAFFFFTKSLKYDPDDCWSRKSRAELYNGYGEGNLHLESLYTQGDALSDAKEALEFFQSAGPRHESLGKMVKQCERLVSDLSETRHEEAQT